MAIAVFFDLAGNFCDNFIAPTPAATTSAAPRIADPARCIAGESEGFRRVWRRRRGLRRVASAKPGFRRARRRGFARRRRRGFARSGASARTGLRRRLRGFARRAFRFVGFARLRRRFVAMAFGSLGLATRTRSDRRGFIP
jgi:hypothetical protein